MDTHIYHDSGTGTRARVARVRAEYPNQLDYTGVGDSFNSVYMLSYTHQNTQQGGASSIRPHEQTQCATTRTNSVNVCVVTVARAMCQIPRRRSGMILAPGVQGTRLDSAESASAMQGLWDCILTAR